MENDSSSNRIQDIDLHYRKKGGKNYRIFRLNDGYDNCKTKKVEVTLIYTWQQEIKESQLKSR
jgi:hypothetical protein